MNNCTIVILNENPILKIDVSSDGKFVAVGQQGDYTGNINIGVWELENHELVHKIESEKFYEVVGLNFVNNTGYIAYSIFDRNSVQFYDLKNQITIPEKLNTPKLRHLSSGAKTTRIVTTGMTIEAWDLETKQRIWTVDDYTELAPNNTVIAKINNEGNLVCVAGIKKQTLLIYDINENALYKTLENAPSGARCMAFSSDAKYVAVIGALSKGVFFWDVEKGQRILTETYNDKTQGYWSLCFHPTGEYFAIGSLVGFISIHSIKDGKSIKQIKAHEGRIWSMCFTPNGKYLISGGDDGLLNIREFKLS